MIRLTSAFIIALLLLFNQRSLAVTLATISAEISGDITQPFPQDSDSGPSSAVSQLSRTVGTTEANAFALVEPNSVNIKLSSVGSGSSNPVLRSKVTALWQDTVFFTRNGVNVLSGSVRVKARMTGKIESEGLTIDPNTFTDINVSFQAGTEFGGAGVLMNKAGHYDQTADGWNGTKSWTAADGVDLRLFFSAYVQNESGLSSVSADFTARILSVAYVNTSGVPDPSVTVRSASGLVYSVPECSSWMTAIGGVTYVLGFRKKRRAQPHRRRDHAAGPVLASPTVERPMPAVTRPAPNV